MSLGYMMESCGCFDPGLLQVATNVSVCVVSSYKSVYVLLARDFWRVCFSLPLLAEKNILTMLWCQ